MVPVGYKTRMGKPTGATGGPSLPDAPSTVATFEDLGMKISNHKLAIWNDYVGLSPYNVLSMLSGKTIPQVLSEGSTMLSISDSGRVVFKWGQSKVSLSTGTGALEISKDLARASEFGTHLPSLKSLGEAVGSPSIGLYVQEGDAKALGALGVVPDVGDWFKVKAKMATALEEYTGRLSTTEKLVVSNLLVGTNPARFSELFSSGLPSVFLTYLLAKVQFGGVYSLDATGLAG